MQLIKLIGLRGLGTLGYRKSLGGKPPWINWVNHTQETHIFKAIILENASLSQEW